MISSRKDVYVSCLLLWLLARVILLSALPDRIHGILQWIEDLFDFQLCDRFAILLLQVNRLISTDFHALCSFRLFRFILSISREYFPMCFTGIRIFTQIHPGGAAYDKTFQLGRRLYLQPTADIQGNAIVRFLDDDFTF